MKQKTCEWCGIKYEPSRNVTYRHKDFCGFKCKEDYIDIRVVDISGTAEDNPGRDLFDWAFQGSSLT